MIKIEKGSLAYENKQVLSDINLEVAEGEFVVVCGASGCGKSSLIRILNGLIPELYEGELEGDFIVNNEKLPTADFPNFVKEIGVVFQNPKTQFFMNEVFSELAFEMENYGVERGEMLRKIDRISDIFELKNYWQKSMHELSGGEKQRIAFASSCMMPHKLFLLDEPSSNLDEKHIDLIQNHLEWLKKEGHTIVVAEHRLYYLMDMADRFIFMKDGRIVHNFTKEMILNLSKEEVTKRGLRSLEKPVLEIKHDDSLNEENKKELIAENISYYYKKELGVRVDQVSFTSQKVTGIIGQNGAGKTTFSQLMSGLLKSKTGTITFNGQKQSTKELLKKSFMVMQDVNLQLFFETVEKEMTAKANRLEVFDEVVKTLELETLLDRHPQTLSGGQKQRVAIATAVLSGKEIIILDEPTSGLDLRHMIEVAELIKKLKQYQVIIMIVSHDKEFLSLCCDDVIEIENNQLIQK
ncbi:MAG: ABC transporter ATP-binding protein [Vagococcus fluvialis]